MPRSLDDLDNWARDHDLRHERELGERREEGRVLIDAVKRHVDAVQAPVREITEKLDALAKTNERQTEILEGSAEERGRRKERDEIAAAKKSTEMLEIERLKVKNEADARAAALELEAKTKAAALDVEKADKIAQRRADNWKIIAGVITTIAGIVIAYLAAHHK